jgi:chorismate dehydratase
MYADRLRIGAVHYLNSKPLVFGLSDDAPEFELIFDLPSRLADGLSDGRLDVALIPSIEFFRDPTYTIVSDACIGCRGPVLSVKLFCRRPPPEIRSVAMDEGSRTSAALVQILLHDRYGLTPRLESLPIGASMEDTNADAVLLIGDRAIHSPAASFADVWDLGDQWCRWSELPFVFAMWVARSGIDTTCLADILGTARDRGVANLETIARAEAAAAGLTVPECLSYLRDNLHFHLGAGQRQGMELFYRRACQLSLVPQGLDLNLDDCRTPG